MPMMWWNSPPTTEYLPLVGSNLIEVIARAYAIVQVGGVYGTGPERGRNFERLFYKLCDRWQVNLTERAGARSVGGQGSASGLKHEVDAAGRGSQVATHWELKYLTRAPTKNDFLIFNSKGLDFLQGHDESSAKLPLYRFFLTGTNVEDECRYFGALWGITIIEPDRLPLPLVYESVIRHGAGLFKDADRRAVRDILPLGFRPLQRIIGDLAEWCERQSERCKCGEAGRLFAKAIVDLQEQIGGAISDCLDEGYPDWLDNLAEDTWREIGGW